MEAKIKMRTKFSSPRVTKNALLRRVSRVEKQWNHYNKNNILSALSTEEKKK